MDLTHTTRMTGGPPRRLGADPHAHLATTRYLLGDFWGRHSPSLPNGAEASELWAEGHSGSGGKRRGGELPGIIREAR